MTNKVLCIVPLYNKINFLPYSIGSVLNQQGADITMVVVDDCSTDGSPEWIEEHTKGFNNVHIIRNEENVGCYQSRNKGLKWAIDNNIEFDYFTVTDPDDISMEGRFQEILNVFNSTPDAMIIKNPYHRYNIDTDVIVSTDDKATEGSAWFRKSVMEEIGYWDNTLRMSGDTEYVKRYCNYCQHKGIDWKYRVGQMGKPLVYCLLDNEGQNLTSLYDGDHPKRRATWDYINEFTAWNKLEDCYYGYENQGHAYAGMGAASLGL